MSGPGQPLDSREWRRFFRSTLHGWRRYVLLRAMDRPTFDKYSRESRDVQESLSLFSVTPSLTPQFLADVAPPFLRLLVRMYQLGDDITAFLLARNLGDLQEDRGLDAQAAWSLQFAGRCARVMRFHEEALLLLERARRCALRAQDDHPLLTEIYDLMGLVCHFAGRLDEAESHYRRSLEILDRWPAAVLRHHTWRSKSRLRGMRLTNLLDLHLVKARSLSGTARAEELAQARSLMAQICEGATGEPAVLGLNEANEGEILMVEGQLQEARALLLRCIRRYDQDSPSAAHALPPMHRLLAQIASEEGNASEAYAHCREGLGLSLRYANSLEEGLIVEATLEIMGRFLRPRVAGAGVSALGAEDWKVVQNLVLLLESKDWYTGSNHSRGVSKLCRLLGSHLASERSGAAGESAAGALVDEQTLGMAGLLHDIGKLRIPWSRSSTGSSSPTWPRARACCGSLASRAWPGSWKSIMKRWTARAIRPGGRS